MKKYYMAFVDFSEIKNVTADKEQLELSRQKMIEYEILTTKGNPSITAIHSVAADFLPQFINRLDFRTSRLKDGMNGIYETMKELYSRKEYMGFYLYLAIMYGFIQWRMPEKIELLPASTQALKIFCTECLVYFERHFVNKPSVSENSDG